MRRTTKASVLSLLGVLLLSTSARAQRRREPQWNKMETKHYEILYSCAPVEAKYLGDWMEFVYGAYSYIMKIKAERKHVIKLFKDRKQWVEYGQPEGAGAYYTIHTKQLVGYYDRQAVFPFFAHEGTHQFIHIAVPDMPKLIPTWFNEGIADCFGSSRVYKGQFRWCQFDVLIAKGRCYTIKEALKDGTARSLADLFKLDHKQFMEDAKLHYAQSWSFVHFLFCYPHVDIPHKVIPNGQYKDAVVVYLDRLRKGDGHDKAWEEALKKIGKTHEEIEAAWKKYVLETLPDVGPQEDDAYLGVRTQESNKGGMEVLFVLPDGPAEKGGILKGDILLFLNKTRLRKQETFIEELKKCKPGEAVEFRVLRDRKWVTLKVTLGRRGDFSQEEPKKKD